MVYQAIAEYWVSADEEEYDVKVDIKFQDRKNDQKLHFNKDNHYTTKTTKVK